MALRARICAYNRHLLFDVTFICSTLTHCGVCDLSVWRLKWEVSYVHQRVWRWKWFSCQSSYVLQRLQLCRASDTVFRREIDSQRQWGYGTWYGDSFPAGKECSRERSLSWYEGPANSQHIKHQGTSHEISDTLCQDKYTKYTYKYTFFPTFHSPVERTTRISSVSSHHWCVQGRAGWRSPEETLPDRTKRPFF